MKYIVPYNDNPLITEYVYKPDSYKVIADRYAILSYSESLTFENVIEANYPKCYGLSESRILEETGITRVRRLSGLNLYGGGVCVGIIDDGVDISAKVLRRSDGTSKISYYYDQTNEIELSGDELNDEMLYEKTVRDKEKLVHGTMLASIICGEKSEGGFEGIAPDSEIIAVSLKPADKYLYEHYNINREAKAYSETDIIEAVDYVVKRAGEKPIVIVIPFETNLGTHDGSGYLEEYLDFINRQLHMAVITVAGNMAIARAHSENRIFNTENEVQIAEFPIYVGRNDTDTFINMILSQGTRPTVIVDSPTGERKQASGNGGRFEFLFEGTSFSIKIERYDYRSEKSVVYMKISGMSEGTWKISVTAENRNREIMISAYLPVTEFGTGEIEFLTPTVENTVTSPGNAVYTCTVGAYDGENGRIYPESGRGRKNGKPELCAPGVNVTAYNCIRGRMTGFTGTSVAAAVTAGASVLIMQWAAVLSDRKYITGTGLKRLLITGSRPVYEGTDSQWGFGILDVAGVFNAIRESGTD